jgi:hypothetical protein
MTPQEAIRLLEQATSAWERRMVLWCYKVLRAAQAAEGGR